MRQYFVVEKCHVNADSAQPRKARNVTRPFPILWEGSGDETSFYSSHCMLMRGRTWAGQIIPHPPALQEGKRKNLMTAWCCACLVSRRVSRLLLATTCTPFIIMLPRVHAAHRHLMHTPLCSLLGLKGFKPY